MKTWIVKVKMTPGSVCPDTHIKYLDAGYTTQAHCADDACAKGAWMAARMFANMGFVNDGATAAEYDSPSAPSPTEGGES